MARKPRKIATLIYPGAQIPDATGPLEVFASADRIASQRSGREANLYATELLARRRGPVELTGGVKLVADRSWVGLDEDLDTRIVVVGIDVDSITTLERSATARSRWPRSACSMARYMEYDWRPELMRERSVQRAAAAAR